MKIIRKPLRFYELFNKLLLTVFKKLPAHILYNRYRVGGECVCFIDF